MSKNKRTTHNRSRTQEYYVFRRIKERCTDPNSSSYKYNGGIGVKCLFNSFEEFFAEVGERPHEGMHLLRIDKEKHFEPGNIKWGFPYRTSITLDGETHTAREWGKIKGINHSVIGWRLKNGWCVRCALNIPTGAGYGKCTHRY